jgi:hypothetical protein
MQFGWLNLTGFLIFAVMLIPNIRFMLRNRHAGNRCTSKLLLLLEQVGRYCCVVLMVFPVLVWKFGFRSNEEMILWAVVCAALLAAYFICWAFYFRKPSLPVALWLAILPSAIFILRGIFLRHWLLVGSGILFAIGHIHNTWVNNRQATETHESVHAAIKDE